MPLANQFHSGIKNWWKLITTIPMFIWMIFFWNKICLIKLR